MQNSELRARVNVQISELRMVNFLETAEAELMDFCRMTGHRSIHELGVGNMTTIDLAVAQYAKIPHDAEFRG